jgi:putative flippase GtrA
MKNKVIALIPSYQPDDNIRTLVHQLSQIENMSIVVVDDGSQSPYAKLFDDLKAEALVLSYPENKGKGHALKTGLAAIQSMHPSEDTVIVTLDGDGQHTPADTLKTAAEAAAHPGSLVLGSRSFPANTPLRSRFGNTVTRWVFRLASGQKVQDTQTGLRAFTVDQIPWLLNVEGERYEYEMNVLLACREHQVTIREVPIETIYLNDNAGSHFNTLRDSWLIYKNILKFASTSFLSFLVDYGLFTLLSLAGLQTAAANISARVVSAAFNFTLNKKVVFHNHDSLVKTGLQYFALAALILAMNTVLLSFLVDTLGANRYLAKILTEITFFTFSYLVQKKLIFRRHDRKEENSYEKISQEESL